MIYIAPKIISYRFVSDKSIAHRLIYQPTDEPNLLQRCQKICHAEVNYFHVYAPFYDSIKSTQVLPTFITLFFAIANSKLCAFEWQIGGTRFYHISHVGILGDSIQQCLYDPNRLESIKNPLVAICSRWFYSVDWARTGHKLELGRSRVGSEQEHERSRRVARWEQSIYQISPKLY